MKTLTVCVSLVMALTTTTLLATVHIDGSPTQQAQIAQWLTQSLGTTVGIDASGNLTIAAGGNASATRLRNMINDAGTSVTLLIIQPNHYVLFGLWNSTTTDLKGPTSGTQTINIADLASTGNVIGSFGFTPDVMLMHEITEVYQGLKFGLMQEDAHRLGMSAERELMAVNGCSWVFRLGDQHFGDTLYGKIKRPDGSFVVIAIDKSDDTHKTKWFVEKTPCTFERTKLIAIPDPDPSVGLFTYNYDLGHTFQASVDSVNSHPTAVAFDASHNMYVAENLPVGSDEVRVIDQQGALVRTMTDPNLVDPEGIAVDLTSGDVFVAVVGRVLRFNQAGAVVGSYSTSIPSFRPTGVAIRRNATTMDLGGDNSIYEIYVSDRSSSQVYRFDVASDSNTGTFRGVFGSGILSGPEGIQIDDESTVWVASTGNHRIYRFTPLGNLEPVGANPFFLEDQGKQLFDVAKVRQDGVYVVDETPGAGQLLLYDLGGAGLLRSYGSGTLQCPRSVGFDFSLDLGELIPIPDPGSDTSTSTAGGASGTRAPAMTTWGVVLLAVLIAAAGALVARRA